MSNKPKKSARRPRRSSSSISDHKRVGRELLPPMLSIGTTPFTFVHWARDRLPDYLWLAAHLHGGKERVLATAVQLDLASAAVAEHVTEMPTEWVLDGTLSSFEQLPETARTALLERLDATDTYEEFVPRGLAHTLAQYGSAPGAWLTARWIEGGLEVTASDAEDWLRPIVAAALDGQGTLATRSKALTIRQLMQAGRLHFGESISFLELLPRYPFDTDDDETAHVESSLRAMFNAVATTATTDWPRDFWRSNWRLFECEWPDIHGDDEAEESDAAKSADAVPTLRDYMLDLQSRTQRLWVTYFETATTTPPDLYDPDRFEVLTGLVGRAVRYVLSFAQTPLMWTMEHGAPILRALLETEIVFRYLLHTEASEPLYAKFKQFGAGKIKLLKLHIEEHIDNLDSPPEELLRYRDYLEAVVNRDIYEEFQSVNLGGSFSGVDTRRMSQAVGMESEYRFVFAPASSNVHGEWGVIDENVFTTCSNPLHRYHRIVAKPSPTLIGSSFVESIVDRATDLVEQYVAEIAGSDGAANAGEE